MDERALRYWIGFNRAKGIGPLRLRALIQHFGDVERAWHAPAGALRQAGLDQRSLHSFLALRASVDLDRELRAVARAGAWVVTLDEDEYPEPLRNIPDPPPMLYVKGTLKKSDNLALAVIGTRRATAYGKAMTRQIVEPLAHAGMVIVSGLARGIDAEAHQSALDAGGRTIAVVANGIDVVYPPEHARLAEAISTHGALISEFSLGEPAESSHFAPRNRIISGLSLGVVIVEAGEHSGAMMTVTSALDQGRDVFAVPGNALSPASRGANSLIQTGARMVTSAVDILDELGVMPPASESRDMPPKAAHGLRPAADSYLPPSAPLNIEDEAEALILSMLTVEPQFIDNLSNQSGLPVGQVSGMLTILELKGLVRQVGVMQYALAQ